MSRVRVFCATSLDGFLAGPDHDLSWLPEPPEGSDEDHGWHAFVADVGCVLVGRTTWDVVEGLGATWPHAERETLVATHRPLVDAPPRVSAARGSIEELVTRARELAGGRDVYLDGGDLVRQGLDAGLVDELILTVCPTILGGGRPLFVGATRRRALRLVGQRAIVGGVVQLTYEPAREDDA